jgi:hypothetical protein
LPTPALAILVQVHSLLNFERGCSLLFKYHTATFIFLTSWVSIASRKSTRYNWFILRKSEPFRVSFAVPTIFSITWSVKKGLLDRGALPHAPAQ